MKKILALALALCMVFALCASGAYADDVTTIDFWYHDGNEVSNAYWNEIIANFEAANPQYKVNYTPLPADSYMTKYITAVATGTAPDVLDLRDTDMATMIGLGCLEDLTDIIPTFAEGDAYAKAGLDVAKSHAYDGRLYVLPMYWTSNICWANKAMLEEKGIEIPATIADLLADCEAYADPANNAYFFSLRGGSGSTENLFDFIFSYAGIDKLFEEDGTCTLSDPKFAEAFDAYASIYWNGWTSSDSLTNGFTEMVAEFGSGTSMFIMHNSSSYGQHVANLGEGNFVNVCPLAGEDGIVVTKALSYCGLSVIDSSEKKEAANAFVEFATNAQSEEIICSKEGRTPSNTNVYASEWYTSDPINAVYTDMLANENIHYLTYPFWLTSWSDFTKNYVFPGLQAVLLKDRTSEDVLTEWAEVLTEAQQEYLATIA